LEIIKYRRVQNQIVTREAITTLKFRFQTAVLRYSKLWKHITLEL